jgi:glycosyltransferase involved in cell wall biosynthesis
MFWKQNDSGIYGRRQDMLVKYLVRHPRIKRIIHFDAPISRDRLRNLLDLEAEPHLSQRNLVYTQTLARACALADSDHVTRRTFIYDDAGEGGLFPGEDEFVRFVKGILEEEGALSPRTVFWVWPNYFPFLEVCAACPPALIVADIVDDHRRWPVPSNYRARLEQHYQEIARVSDVMFVNCLPMKESMQELGAMVHVVPNALELPHELVSLAETPEELRSLPRPIIGYVGNLDARRLDLGLLAHVATHRPEWQFILIGSTHAGDDVLTLRRFPNVHFLGVKRYDEATSYIRHFDVALVPHLRNALTDAMNPLKAFVYFALGIPVVSTDIMNLGELRGEVTVIDSPESCIAAIEQIVSADRPATSPPRAEDLKRHAWPGRVDRIVTLIERAWAQRQLQEAITLAEPEESALQTPFLPDDC